MKDGFVKVAAASPVIRVADCDYNARRVIECIREADRQGVKVLVFPELTLTGVSCWDLFRHRVILDGAEQALAQVAKATQGSDMLVFVGLPYTHKTRLYSVAAAVSDGEILALIPRQTGDERFAAPIWDGEEAEICGTTVELGGDILFESNALSELRVAVRLGIDREGPESPVLRHAQAGATLIADMAGFAQTLSSTEDARLELRYESRRGKAAIVLAAPGRGESSTDRVYSGLCLVAENGKLLAEQEKADALAVTETCSCSPICAGTAACSAGTMSTAFSCGATSLRIPSSPGNSTSTPICRRIRRSCPPTVSAASTCRCPAWSGAWNTPIWITA